MKVSDSKDCVAYHYKQKRHYIAGPIEAGDNRFDLEYIKKYTLHLTDLAKKTRTQRRIRAEIENSTSLTGLLSIVDRVIENGNKTEFVNYSC